MLCLYRREFASVEELDAFVMVIKLVRGLECKWNRLERKAWMWCDASLYHELQCHWPTEPYPPCETVPPRETVSA